MDLNFDLSLKRCIFKTMIFLSKHNIYFFKKNSIFLKIEFFLFKYINRYIDNIKFIRVEITNRLA